jgi:hypothetical protein
MQQQPVMVQVSPREKPQGTSFQDVIVGSFGLTGALILAAVVSGATLAGLWILWRKWRRPFDHGAPPSLGATSFSSKVSSSQPGRPPSSQDQ